MPTDAHRPTKAPRAWRPGSEMQTRDDRRENAQPLPQDAPNLHACFHPLYEQIALITNSCICILLPDPASDNPPHKVSPTVDTRQVLGISHKGDPCEMRPQATWRPCALLQPHPDRLRTPSSALTPALASGHAGTSREGRRDGGSTRRMGGPHGTHTAPH